MTADRRRRQRMVAELRRLGIRDERVLAALGHVPREAFVAPAQRLAAYRDAPLPIGAGQTISQPFVVARMAEALDLETGDRVLEIGTGSGYAAAVLARLAGDVHSVERHPELARSAAERLARLGIDRVRVHVGDGTLGWPEAAPYDAIVVAAASPSVPPALLEQLRAGGRLVIPVGDPEAQSLWRLVRRPDGRCDALDLGPVRFVPLVGAAGWPETATSGDGPDLDSGDGPFEPMR